MHRTRFLCLTLTSGLLLGLGCDRAADRSGAVHAGKTHADGLFTGLTFDEAKAKAAKDSKLVMIDFYADWCGPCRMLDEQTWKDAQVRKWLGEKAISLKVNIDDHKELASQFRITSIPALVFLDGAGKEVKRLVGFQDAKQFLAEAGPLAK